VNIDFLDTITSASMTLRKISKLTLFQNDELGGWSSFDMRPQIHVMVIAPFGTAKSSITKKIKTNKEWGKRVFCIDNFTKASIEGTINKNGEFVPPFIVNCGGKMLIVDEWNSIDTEGQEAMLSILENQIFSRSLGFKLNSSFRINKRYCKVEAYSNIIEGNIKFACMVYAMEFPLNPNSSQKSKALLSRFSPIFIEPNIEMMKAITSGNFSVNIRDYSQNVDTVKITLDVTKEVHEKYFEYLETNRLFPRDTDDLGFVTRGYSEIIRYGVYNYLSKHITNEKDIKITSSEYFLEMFIYIDAILTNFINRKTRGKQEIYRKFVERIGAENIANMNVANIAKKMGVSRVSIYRWNEEFNIKSAEGEEKDGESINSTKSISCNFANRVRWETIYCDGNND